MFREMRPRLQGPGAVLSQRCREAESLMISFFLPASSDGWTGHALGVLLKDSFLHPFHSSLSSEGDSKKKLLCRLDLSRVSKEPQSVSAEEWKCILSLCHGIWS